MGRDTDGYAACTTCAAQCSDSYSACPRCGSRELLVVGAFVRNGTIQIETRLRSLEEADSD